MKHQATWKKLGMGLGLLAGGLTGLYLWQRRRYRRSLPPLLARADAPGTALITGASSGIGEAFARRLAQQGYNLVLVARREARLQALAAELAENHAVTAEVLVADLADPEAVARVEARLHTLDDLMLLVNNAGFGLPGYFAQQPIAGPVDMINVHVVATVRLARAALPAMVARGRGAIINVSSVAGFYALPGNATYSATKAYLNKFTESLRQELDGTGVRVQALCPGFTRTEFQDVSQTPSRGLPDWVWMSSDFVVAASLRDLERGAVISVPGVGYKALVALARLLPGWMLYTAGGLFQRWRAGKSPADFGSFRKRTYASFSALAEDFRTMLGQREAIRRAMRTVSPTFRERLMLAVTQVNGCRYCAQYHAQQALEDGLDPDEIAALLEGVIADCPPEERTAILYAQHWADTGGQPDAEARAAFVAAYGEAQAQSIEVLLQMIKMGNYMGNLLDYILYRLSGGKWGV